MPKKRSTIWSQSKKEKQIITARLIEISLKVEDCIYKHKPISVWEAEQYIREVSSHKVQCSRDERSLQVIEKLTRCMKAIIFDHQEPEIHTTNGDSSISAGVVSAGSISPVYSIPEEDRSRLTQIAERANDNIEIIDLSNIDDDDSMHNETNTATANYTGSIVTVDVDIHREMSSLSLRDAGEPLDIPMSTETNCSQSILNNFEGVERMEQSTINITSQISVADGFGGNGTGGRKTTNLTQPVGNNSVDKPDENVKTTIAPMKPIITCVAKNNLKLNTVVQNKEPIKVTKATSYITNAFNPKNNNIIFEAFHPVTNNIPESQKQTWYDTNRTCTINDFSHATKYTSHSTQHRQIYDDVNQGIVKKAGILNCNIPRNISNAGEKENQPIQSNVNSAAPLMNNRPISTPAVIKENTVTKKKRGPKKKLKDEKEIKQKNKRVSRAPKGNKDKTQTTTNKMIPIYNTNVVDDLSWIENIRYVREIREDENDFKLHLEESFWDNFYLPANWSENEFV